MQLLITGQPVANPKWDAQLGSLTPRRFRYRPTLRPKTQEITEMPCRHRLYPHKFSYGVSSQAVPYSSAPSAGCCAIEIAFAIECQSGRQLSRCSSLAGIDHGNLRGQLQIDQQVDTAIDLVPQCSLLRRDDLLKYRNVLHAQCKELLVNSRRSIHVILRLRIGHGVVVCGILLNHRPPFVIGFDGFPSVLVKNRPELSGLVGGDGHVLRHDLLALSAKVRPKHLDVLVLDDVRLRVCSRSTLRRGLLRRLLAHDGYAAHKQRADHNENCYDALLHDSFSVLTSK